MSQQTGTKATLLALLERVQDMVEEIPDAAEVEVSLTMPVDDIEELRSIYNGAGADPTNLKESQRQDVTWLAAEITNNGGYKRQYVAVLGQKVRASGPSKAMVEIQLQRSVGYMLAACAVIMPVGIGDEQTDDELRDLMASLDLDISLQ